MYTQLEELWMDAIETKVGEQIVTYLRGKHSEYQDIGKRQKKLIENYPMLLTVLDGDGEITLNADEHRAFKEYLANRDDMERLEREYYYYYGQSHVFSYGAYAEKPEPRDQPGWGSGTEKEADGYAHRSQDK